MVWKGVCLYYHAVLTVKNVLIAGCSAAEELFPAFEQIVSMGEKRGEQFDRYGCSALLSLWLHSKNIACLYLLAYRHRKGLCSVWE